MRGSRGVMHNLGVLTMAQVAAQLLNLWALVYLARYLGEHWFGVVQVGVAFSAYALITAEWGLFSLGIREVARFDEPGQVLAYARAHQGLLAILAGIVLLAGVAILPLFPFYAQDKVIFLLYLALVVPQVWNQEWLGLGLEQMSWVGAARTTASLVNALLILLLLRHLDGFAGWHVWRWVPAIFLFSFTAGNLVLVFPVRSWLGGLAYPVLRAAGDWKRRLGETAPIGASIVTMRVLMNGDMILLGILAQPEVAGRYAASAKIGFTLVIAMEVLWKALLPRLSRLASQGDREFLNRFQVYFGLVSACLLPVAVGGVMVGPQLMALVYGDRFSGVGPIFQVLVVSYSILSLGWFLGNTLLAADRQKEFFPPLVVAALVAVIANILLVPRMGGLGAAFGMLASHLTLLAILAVVCRDWFRRSLLALVPFLLPGLAAMVLLLVWSDSLPVAVRIVVAGTGYLLGSVWGVRRWLVRMNGEEVGSRA